MGSLPYRGGVPLLGVPWITLDKITVSQQLPPRFSPYTFNKVRSIRKWRSLENRSRRRSSSSWIAVRSSWWWFQIFWFLPLPGEMIQFWLAHIFQLGNVKNPPTYSKRLGLVLGWVSLVLFFSSLCFWFKFWSFSWRVSICWVLFCGGLVLQIRC